MESALIFRSIGAACRGADFTLTGWNGIVKIDGYIEGVMESFPLQLELRTEKGNISVSLEAGTRVLKGKSPVDPGTLLPGMRVEIRGRPSSPDGITAEDITILD